MAKAARNRLDKLGFTEVETPTLIKSQPLKGRVILSSRHAFHPVHGMRCRESPQLQEQLLMVSVWNGIIQLARCYRDEDCADRQPVHPA